MEFVAESVLEHNRKRAYEAYRDHLPDLVDGVKNVDEIEVLTRTDVRGGVELHNLWHSSARLPGFARKLVSPDAMSWDDRASWKDRQFACEWTLRLHSLPDHLECVGRHEFSADGRSRVHIRIEAELTVNVEQMPAVPRQLRASLCTQLEKWISSVMVKNLLQINDALDDFLTEL